MVIFDDLFFMTPLLTEFIFVGIIGAMLLVLAGLNAVAQYNIRKRLKQSITAKTTSNTSPGAKIINLPQNSKRPANEHFFVKDFSSEGEIV